MVFFHGAEYFPFKQVFGEKEKRRTREGYAVF